MPTTAATVTRRLRRRNRRVPRRWPPAATAAFGTCWERRRTLERWAAGRWADLVSLGTPLSAQNFS